MDRKRIPIKEGWFRLWYDMGAQSANGWDVFFDIFQRYCEPQRYYHDYSHVLQLLEEFKPVRQLCRNPNAVEMFLYTHDVIYIPGARDNEERSAEFTCGEERGILRHARVAKSFIQEVNRLILLSKEHLTAKDDIDGCVSIDLDLSILGQPPLVFDGYEYKTRKEWVLTGVASDEEFTHGRAEFLTKFLERKPIYCTPHFRAKYEKTARQNLRRSLKRLEQENTLLSPS